MELRNKKTGEIKDLETIVHEAFKVHEVETIKNIEANWEDYKPKEPLIKDDKIRKAVRAWAEASNVGVVIEKDDYCFIDTESAANIRFYDKIGVFLKGSYTIAELCGEGE